MNNISLLMLVLLFGATLAGCVQGEDSSDNLDETGEPVPPGLTSDEWYQYGGESHASVARSLHPSLDVVARGEIPYEDVSVSTRDPTMFLPTPHGLSMALSDWEREPPDEATGTCWLFTVQAIEPVETHTGPKLDCDPDESVLLAAGIQAYDPVTDAVLVCTAAQEDRPIVRALDAATGEERWGVTLAQAGVIPSSFKDPVPWVDDAWTCGTFSIDLENRFVIAPIHDLIKAGGTDNRVLAIDLDSGEVLWSQAVALPAVASQYPALDVLGSEVGLDFVPKGAVLTDVGIALHGYVDGTNTGWHRAAVWMSREGELIGFDRCCTQSEQNTNNVDPFGPPDMDMLATNGRLAAVAMDTRLLIIDPLTTEPTTYELPPWGQNCDYRWTAPAWWENHLVVARGDTLSSIDSNTGQDRWDWSNPAGWGLIDLLIRPPNDLYVLAGRTDPVSTDLALLRFDLHEGTVLQQLPIDKKSGREVQLDVEDPLSFDVAESGTARCQDTQIVPLTSGGLLVVDADGMLAVLGESSRDRKPVMDLSTEYPRAGEALSVTATQPPPGSTPAAVDRLLLAWGDGATGLVEPGVPAQHSYIEEGLYTLRLTAVYDNQSTSTTMQVVDVGGTPPEELNLLQQAFDPENYDLTFGVLGVLIALFGGLFALYRHQRGRSRIARELQALENAYNATKDDPIACETALAERKAHARGLFADGKLNETQFSVLDRRIDELGSAHRMEAIEDSFAFLSVGMARTLREMLADGKISDWERDHFIEALEHDKHLTQGQKTKVRKQVEAWFSRDAGVEA